MSIENARHAIDEAITALSVEMHRSPADGDLDWTPVDPIQATIAIHLERVDSAIGLSGTSMFWPLAESIKQAMAALHLAKQELRP